MPVCKHIAAAFAALTVISASPKAEAGPPPEGHVVYVQNADWIMVSRRETFTARMSFNGDDGTSAVLTVTCSTERGTVSYTRQEFIDQPPTPVTMAIISGGATILSEEATADVAGYATDLIRKRNFLLAMQKLQDMTDLRMDILSTAGSIKLSFMLRSDSGFRQAVRRCPGIME